MLGWYVAKIKPRCDLGVERLLSTYGVESYAPEILVLKGGGQVSEPLFPGYAFVRVDTQSNVWQRVRWAQGVSYFLPSQRSPVSVLDSLVDDIRSRVARWNGVGWMTAFGAGDPVRIETGPLGGLGAIFQRYVPGNRRCEVLISLVGADHRVSVDPKNLRALVVGRGTFTYAPAG